MKKGVAFEPAATVKQENGSHCSKDMMEWSRWTLNKVEDDHPTRDRPVTHRKWFHAGIDCDGGNRGEELVLLPVLTESLYEEAVLPLEPCFHRNNIHLDALAHKHSYQTESAKLHAQISELNANPESSLPPIDDAGDVERGLEQMLPWTFHESCYLLSLYSMFNGNWTVIADRYAYHPPSDMGTSESERHTELVLPGTQKLNRRPAWLDHEYWKLFILCAAKRAGGAAQSLPGRSPPTTVDIEYILNIEYPFRRSPGMLKMRFIFVTTSMLNHVNALNQVIVEQWANVTTKLNQGAVTPSEVIPASRNEQRIKQQIERYQNRFYMMPEYRQKDDPAVEVEIREMETELRSSGRRGMKDLKNALDAAVSCSQNDSPKMLHSARALTTIDMKESRSRQLMTEIRAYMDEVKTLSKPGPLEHLVSHVVDRSRSLALNVSSLWVDWDVCAAQGTKQKDNASALPYFRGHFVTTAANRRFEQILRGCTTFVPYGTYPNLRLWDLTSVLQLPTPTHIKSVAEGKIAKKEPVSVKQEELCEQDILRKIASSTLGSGRDRLFARGLTGAFVPQGSQRFPAAHLAHDGSTISIYPPTSPWIQSSSLMRGSLECYLAAASLRDELGHLLNLQVLHKKVLADQRAWLSRLTKLKTTVADVIQSGGRAGGCQAALGPAAATGATSRRKPTKGGINEVEGGHTPWGQWTEDEMNTSRQRVEGASRGGTAAKLGGSVLNMVGL